MNDQELHDAMYDARTRWHYKFVKLHENELQDQLTSYGVWGWEVVSIIIDPSFSTEFNTRFHVVFKRPYWLEQQEHHE